LKTHLDVWCGDKPPALEPPHVAGLDLSHRGASLAFAAGESTSVFLKKMSNILESLNKISLRVFPSAQQWREELEKHKKLANY